MLGAAFIYRITHAEEGAKMLIDAGGLPALVACWEAGCWEAAGVGEALGEEAARQRQHGYRGQGTGYRPSLSDGASSLGRTISAAEIAASRQLADSVAFRRQVGGR